MSNKNNRQKPPKVEAPVVEKKEEAAAAPEATTVVDINATKGLSQSEKLQFATELRHRVTELKEEENPPHALIAGYNMIRDVTFIDLAAGEIACGDSAMGFIFSGNETAYKALQVAATSLGVTLPEFKSLPAPSKSDLEKHGLSSVGNTKLIAASEIKVSKEAKDKKKAEAKLAEEAKSKDYMKDPTKIETDEQLKEALGFQLVNPSIANPIERLITTAQFLRSYREVLAEKSNDPKAELDKIHECTLADLLQDIITMVPPTFVATGFGKRLCTLAEDANSVVPAFCGFKNCVLDRKTKKYKYSDEDIAAFVRVLIVWYISAKNAEMSEAIKAKEANIAVLKKDAKANAKGIETENKKIAGLKSAIAHFTDMMSIVNNPSFDIADRFIAIYNDNTDKEYLHAKSIYKEIINTYYDGLQISELEFDSLLLNVQQHVGIILNYFNDAIGQREDYNESNLISFEPAAEPEKKDGEGEEESKN